MFRLKNPCCCRSFQCFRAWKNRKNHILETESIRSNVVALFTTFTRLNQIALEETFRGTSSSQMSLQVRWNCIRNCIIVLRIHGGRYLLQKLLSFKALMKVNLKDIVTPRFKKNGFFLLHPFWGRDYKGYPNSIKVVSLQHSTFKHDHDFWGSVFAVAAVAGGHPTSQLVGYF